MKILETIQALFPMSKGALLACSAIITAGYVQSTAINDTLKEVVSLQRETRDDVHSLDVRMTVVETKLESVKFVTRQSVASFDSDGDYRQAQP